VKKWQQQRLGKPWRAMVDILGEVLVALALVLVLPLVLRLPLQEWLRSMPDIAWWIILTACLSLVTAGLKLSRLKSIRTTKRWPSLAPFTLLLTRHFLTRHFLTRQYSNSFDISVTTFSTGITRFLGSYRNVCSW
jgi:pheromone shutdown protein TraB